MTKIYLVRHAEAEGNLYRRIQGHLNGNVTPLGRRQIAAVGKRFSSIHLDAVYSSDLIRAYETAKAVAAPSGVPVQATSRLREVNVGIWEDQPWGNIEYAQPDQMYNFSSDPEHWIVEGAERYADLRERMLSTVRELGEHHDGQTIAIVSHGMAIRTLLFALLDRPYSEFKNFPHGDNTAVSLLTLENGKFHVEFFNDNRHLPPELSTFARQTWWKEENGADKNNLRIVPVDLSTEADWYLESYAETWKAAHGSLEGFHPALYLTAAKRHVQQDSRALMKALRFDEPIGIVELDLQRGAEAGFGWICLCYIKEQYRGKSYGLQLLGHAVSLYRHLGRRALRLCVATDNAPAIRFYQRCEFREVDQLQGVLTPLLVMEKKIEL